MGIRFPFAPGCSVGSLPDLISKCKWIINSEFYLTDDIKRHSVCFRCRFSGTAAYLRPPGTSMLYMRTSPLFRNPHVEWSKFYKVDIMSYVFKGSLAAAHLPGLFELMSFDHFRAGSILRSNIIFDKNAKNRFRFYAIFRIRKPDKQRLLCLKTAYRALCQSRTYVN